MTTTRARRGTLTAAVATLLALSATACGSDGDDGGGGESTTAAAGTEEELRQAVDDSFAAMLDADAEAVHTGWSAACREAMTAAELGEVFDLAAAAPEGAALDRVEIAEFDGTSARVLATISDPTAEGGTTEQEIPWVWEDGAWRDDSCGTEDAGDTGHTEPPNGVAVGEAFTWDDGVSVTVSALTEVPLDTLGESSGITEGSTPFQVEMTIVNGSDRPVDTAVFEPYVADAVGTEAEALFFEGSEPLDGEFAPGETAEYTPTFAIPAGEDGTELVVEVWYTTTDTRSASWTGTLA
ncbi:hypothetical protein [Streptomyces sp. NPDC049879]|uniref:hypothetical protein n=1 Tax=Streptomyces sp. NPDC049879 TaxID=3365598 RepID=UPI0037A1B5FB